MGMNNIQNLYKQIRSKSIYITRSQKQNIVKNQFAKEHSMITFILIFRIYITFYVYLYL